MRSFFLIILSQLIEFISFFKRLKNNNIVFTSTQNKNFNFNSKYLFLFFLKERSDLNVYFIIDDEILRKQLIEKYGKRFLSTTNVKDLCLISTSKVWLTSDLTTPYLPVIKNRKRYIVHIGHGVPLKKIILAPKNIPLHKYIHRLFRSRLFTHVTAYSQEFQQIMERAFKNNKIEYIPLGQPRNDALSFYTKAEQLKKIKEQYPDLPEHKQAILYAPTWRSYDTVKFFPFHDMTAKELNNELKKNDTVLFLRKHPYFPSLLNQEFLEQSNIYFFNSDLFPEIMDYLSYFDKLITDYSSIYLDFLCLDRPIAFIPYDIEQYTKHTGFTIPYEEFTPGKHIKTKEEFYSFVINIEDNFGAERAEIAKLVNAKPAGNCEENYQFIQELLKK